MQEADAREVGVALRDALGEDPAFFDARIVLRDFGLGRADEDVVALGGADACGDLADAGGFDEQAGVLVGAREGFRYGVDRKRGGRGEGEAVGLGAVAEGFLGGDVILDGLAEFGDFVVQQAVAHVVLPIVDGFGLHFVVGREAVRRALVEEDEDRGAFAAVDFGAPFLLV